MKKKKEADMSNTFVLEVGQKSAIFDEGLDEGLDEVNDSDEVESDMDDDFFDDSKKIKKKKKQKRNKKKNNGFVTTLLMILCVGLGIGISYCYFIVYGDVLSRSKKSVKVEKSTDEELLPDGVFSKSLIEKYDSYSVNMSDIYKALYDKDKIKVEDISLEYIKSVAAKRALYLNKDSSDIAFSSDDFHKSLSELFGDKITVQDGDIVSPNFKYNSKQKEYTYDDVSDTEESDGYKLIRKVVKSVKKDSSLEINVAVAVTLDGKVYKSLDKDSVINDLKLSDFKIDTDYTKLNQYKYIFNYDKDNDNYILDSIELMK